MLNRTSEIDATRIWTMRLTTCAILAAVMLMAVPTIVTPTQNAVFAETDDSDIQFVSNAEMIEGHMAQAVANKEKNDLPLAKAHAGHPITEHYSILEPAIDVHDAQLSSEIKTALDGLAGNVDTMTASDFKVETERIGKLLDNAVSEVLPASRSNEVKFNAQVIIALVSQVEQEYDEAVQGGKIIAMVEYQDAQAFTARANIIFTKIQGNLSPHEMEIAADFFINLNSSMNRAEDTSKIEAQVDEIKNEIREGAGLPAESETGKAVSTVHYIENVRALLKQLSAEYKNGNFTGAEELVTTAYLDNFEHVEIELIRHNATGLKTETEQMLRVELRDMIKNRVASDQIDNQISSINAKLDQAVTIVPEFPIGVTTVAIGSMIAAVTLVGGLRRNIESKSKT